MKSFASVLATVLLLSLLHVGVEAARTRDRGTAKPPNREHHRKEQFIENEGTVVEKSDLDMWIHSGNLAKYRSLQVTESVTVPMHINVLFIGFNEDGNADVKLDQDKLAPWFEKITDRFKHTVVDAGMRPKSHDPVSTVVEYNFLFNVIELSPVVATVVKNALLHFVRPEDPLYFDYTEENYPYDQAAETHFHVDATKMGAILESLTYFLSVNSSSTLFVLNPVRPVAMGQVYGYRSGFSDAEMNLLRDFSDSLLNLIDGEKSPVMMSQDTTKTLERHLHPAPIEAPKGNKKLTFDDRVEHSEHWANSALNEQENKSMEKEAMLDSMPPEEGPDSAVVKDSAYEHAIGGKQDEKDYLKMSLGYEYVHEDCLVDSWIGSDRYAFVDLAAGPFQWGPVVGGEGVRTDATLPSPTILNQKMGFDEEDYDDEEFDEHAMQREQLDAEIVMVEEFLERSCKTAARQRTELCSNLLKHYHELVDWWDQEFENDTPPEKPKQPESEFQNYREDNFMSHVGSVIESSLRHVFAPSSGPLPTFFPETVHFHLFVITSHSSYEPLDAANFNLDEFKTQLMRFKLPNQNYRFSQKTFSMASDPALSIAYSTSLRSAVIPTLKVDGTFSAVRRLYIESHELQHQLRMVNPDIDDGDADHHSATSKVIPIFLFSLDKGQYPVFIDKYHQAKALDDMVIAVQSNYTDWSSHLSCNQKPINWNLRNPLRATLAATLLHMTSLLPNHVAHNQAHGKSSQEWLWSVGNSPLSYTTNRWQFSQVHVDAAHRNYVVGALNMSVSLVNEGVRILESIQTTTENFEGKDSLPLQKLFHLYSKVRRFWLSVTSAMHHLDWVTATNQLNQMVADSKEFKQAAMGVEHALDKYKCSSMPAMKEDSSLSWLPFLVIVIVVLAIMIYRLVGKKKFKPKLN